MFAYVGDPTSVSALTHTHPSERFFFFFSLPLLVSFSIKCKWSATVALQTSACYPCRVFTPAADTIFKIYIYIFIFFLAEKLTSELIFTSSRGTCGGRNKQMRKKKCLTLSSMSLSLSHCKEGRQGKHKELFISPFSLPVQMLFLYKSSPSVTAFKTNEGK